MAADSEKKTPKGAGRSGKTQQDKTNEEIVQGFQDLRTEQRQIAGKLSELEGDLTEHKVVIDALKDIDGERRCFRLVGGVLVERTVKDVLPALERNNEQISTVIEALKDKLISKGKDIVDYKEKHNIRIKGLDDINLTEKGTPEAGQSAPGSNSQASSSKHSGSGVLVPNKTTAES